MHPLGLVKLMHYEIVMRSLNKAPRLDLFKAFFRVSKKPWDWYSFDKTDLNINWEVPQSSKEKYWKNKFFFVDVVVIPGRMVFHKAGEELVNNGGVPDVKRSVEYRCLIENATNIQLIPKDALVAVGMSKLYFRPGFRPGFHHIKMVI